MATITGRINGAPNNDNTAPLPGKSRVASALARGMAKQRRQECGKRGLHKCKPHRTHDIDVREQRTKGRANGAGFLQ